MTKVIKFIVGPDTNLTDYEAWLVGHPGVVVLSTVTVDANEGATLIVTYKLDGIF